MAGNFEGIKTRNFGIEIEMTGLTRCQAARAIAKVFGGTAFHEGGSYDKYIVRDEQGRTWSMRSAPFGWFRETTSRASA